MKPTDPPSSPRDPAAGGHSASAAHGAHHHYTAEELRNVDVAHEHSDINIRAIVIAAIALAVIGLAAHVAMYGMFRYLDKEARENDPAVSPLAAPPTQMPSRTTGIPAFGGAPGPQLLTNEYAVLEQHRAFEDAQLQGYGWVNEQAGVARVPIAAAKKLLLERGLPSRETAAARDPTLGTNRPSTAGPSSGRTADGPPRGTGLPEVK